MDDKKQYFTHINLPENLDNLSPKEQKSYEKIKIFLGEMKEREKKYNLLKKHLDKKRNLHSKKDTRLFGVFRNRHF